jgi:NAD(P)H-dependent flavin oxidoreductase YrpB (nitropropane dioxygenase family)
MGWKGVLGFDYGVVQAPLGPDISGPELAAAVADAGAIGLLRLPDWPAPDHVRELIRRTRSLTERPFGAAIVLAFPQEENLRVVLEEKLAVLQVYWGEFPRERVDEAHRAGVKVLHQVGSVEEAAKAKEAGVDGIIVQGREAGGHVIGQEGLLPLLPRVVDLVSDSGIPVIAAGGIVDGRGYAAALALGAQGVCLGTRFVATEESFAHPLYKKKLIEMNCTDYTNVFGRARWPGAPQRVLETPFFVEWKNLPDEETEENQPIIGHSIIHGVHKDVPRFAGTVPNATATGDINSMAMYAGQGVGLITEIIPAGEVVKRLVAEAQHVIREKLSDFPKSSE